MYLLMTGLGLPVSGQQTWTPRPIMQSSESPMALYAKIYVIIHRFLVTVGIPAVLEGLKSG